MKPMFMLALLGAAAAGAGGVKMVQYAQSSARAPVLERACITRQSTGWIARGVCNGGTAEWPAAVPVRASAPTIGAAATAVESACSARPAATP